MNRNVFHVVGILEGLSFLILLGIAMPLKYVWGIPVATKIAGLIHGILFIFYIVIANELAQNESWPKRQRMAAFVAAVLPFGPFVFNHRINLKEQD